MSTIKSTLWYKENHRIFYFLTLHIKTFMPRFVTSNSVNTGKSQAIWCSKYLEEWKYKLVQGQIRNVASSNEGSLQQQQKMYNWKTHNAHIHVHAFKQMQYRLGATVKFIHSNLKLTGSNCTSSLLLCKGTMTDGS